VHVFWMSRSDLNRGDIQVLFTPASYQEGKAYVLDDHPGMSCGAHQQRPESKGHVRIMSPDPAALPTVQPNYLAERRDQEVIVAALKFARALLNSRAMAPYLTAETLPGDGVRTDAEWLDYARCRGSTAYHLVGTCRMAPPSDRTAVVDDELRVYGFESLRVVDTSIMPQVPSANTMAATLMVAEKAADMIRGRPPLPAAALRAGPHYSREMRDQSQTVDIVHNYANGLFDEVFCNEISGPAVWWPGPISGGPMNYSGWLINDAHRHFWNVTQPGVGAQFGYWSQCACPRCFQQIRCDIGPPRRVILFGTEQATLVSVFWARKVLARRPLPMMAL